MDPDSFKPIAHLYTIVWTQQYATEHQRPFLRGQQEHLERLIEDSLESSNFKEANELIERIKKQ